MNKETKIQLLPFEIELVSKADLILTKNAVLQKLKHFLEEVQADQQSFLKKNDTHFPKEVLKISPKISRGENYKGLPWLMLDNPRFFEQKNTFAIRTMFWWGNFFSVTFHVSGKYKTASQEKILSTIKKPDYPGFYLCTGNSEWEHHFEETNYKKIIDIPANEVKKIIEEKSFLKIAAQIPIGPLSKIEKLLQKDYELLAGLNF